ncbi:MAG: hypothetical protein ACKVS8_00640 [Phycisphaerales bacterium]
MASADPPTRAAHLLGVACALCCLGCAGRAVEWPLPTYPTMSDEESLRVIALRQARITTVSAQCDILLTDADGQRVHLDGVLLAMPLAPTGPRVRLRAWKLGRPVFDLTLTDGTAWLIAPENAPLNDRGTPSSGLPPPPADAAASPARRIGAALDRIGPRFFQAATVVRSSPETITATGAGADSTTCEIDRVTLTPRRFIPGGATDSAGTASDLRLSEYRLIGEIVWAHRLRLNGPGGAADVLMSDVELNGDLPPGAFTPPVRARRFP